MFSIVLLASVSLLLIPAMIRASGVAAWADIAVGQNVGALAAIVMSFGWALSGPAAIAAASDGVRRGIFWQSLWLRGLLFLPVSALAAGIAWLVSPGHSTYAAVGALAMAVQGLTTRWYFVGVSRPVAMVFGDTLPRVAGTAIGIAAMAMGANALFGLAGQFVGVMMAAGATAAMVAYWTRGAAPVKPNLRATLQDHFRNTGINIVGALYSSSSVVIVSLIAHPILPVFALYDRFLSQGIAGLTPIGQVLQGWVPKVQGRQRKQRALQATYFSAALSVAIVGAGALLAEPLLVWLGDGAIPVHWSVAVLVSILLGLSVVESVTSRAGLIALGASVAVSRITVMGIALSLVLFVIGVKSYGVAGAYTGLIIGMLLRCLWLLFALTKSRAPDLDYLGEPR